MNHLRIFLVIRLHLHNPDKQMSLVIYLTLIPSCVGGAGVDPPTCQIRTILLVSLALTMPIFNKKSHRSGLYPNFEGFHSSCPRRFLFVENWHTKSQGHKKNCPHFICRSHRPFPSHTADNYGNFTQKILVQVYAHHPCNMKN